MRHRRLSVITLALGLFTASPAVTEAEQQSPPPIPGLPASGPDQPPAPGSLADELARTPSCRALTNGCEVCARRAGDTAACSTPGIACQPGAWTCANSPTEAPPPPVPAPRPSAN